MKAFQNDKDIVLFDAATAATNGTATSNVMDAREYDAVKILIWAQCTAANTTTAPTTLTVQHSNDLTTYSTVTGLVQATDYTVQAVSSTTQSTVGYKLVVQRTGAVGPYLRVQITPGETGQTWYGCGTLTGARVWPITDAAKGATEYADNV